MRPGAMDISGSRPDDLVDSMARNATTSDELSALACARDVVSASFPDNLTGR
jgi:hypothetical protein